ncbi:MAG: 4'-phosphopantetheinyl transferase superfamily protein [Gammaproteobacteria bacterium]|nr:4'-phosphopantetheinyl transferase superfamily protein [Gammaproteobacteria bacterium]MYF37147.1 4'-phosphopantetheinyl transferase superfamily protein [Gammaproteobacteria bacterium]
MRISERKTLIELAQNSNTTCWWHTIYQTHNRQVVHVDLSKNIENEATAFCTLDEQERTRAQAFHSDTNRRQFVLCRAALRANLCMQHGLDNSKLQVFAERNEKPVAIVAGKTLTIEFNVSHAEGHGLLAFARQGRIGVDVENRESRPVIDEILYSVFSPEEQRLLRQTHEPAKRKTFFRLWTFKEALIKATGEGFRRDTSEFSIPDSLLGQATSASMKLSDMPHIVWKIVNLETDQFAAAVAHELIES